MGEFQIKPSCCWKRAMVSTGLRGSGIWGQGSEEQTACERCGFPACTPDAAAWLVRERRVKAVGIDTASIDHGRSTTFDTHVTLLTHQVPIFQHLAELHRLPDRDFTVIALPMKIAGGTGWPLAHHRGYCSINRGE